MLVQTDSLVAFTDNGISFRHESKFKYTNKLAHWACDRCELQEHDEKRVQIRLEDNLYVAVKVVLQCVTCSAHKQPSSLYTR